MLRFLDILSIFTCVRISGPKSHSYDCPPLHFPLPFLFPLSLPSLWPSLLRWAWGQLFCVTCHLIYLLLVYAWSCLKLAFIILAVIDSTHKIKKKKQLSPFYTSTKSLKHKKGQQIVFNKCNVIFQMVFIAFLFLFLCFFFWYHGDWLRLCKCETIELLWAWNFSINGTFWHDFVQENESNLKCFLFIVIIT